MKLVALTSKCLKYTDGEVLFSENEHPDFVYLVLTGKVEIFSGDGTSIVRGENSLIGETAVFCNRPRLASVRAKGEVQVLQIEKNMFLRLVTRNPDVALDVMRQLNEKLLEVHRDNVNLRMQLGMQQ